MRPVSYTHLDVYKRQAYNKKEDLKAHLERMEEAKKRDHNKLGLSLIHICNQKTMKRKITPELSSKDWKEFCSRFHFDNDKLPLIRALYTAMLPLVDAFAYCLLYTSRCV